MALITVLFAALALAMTHAFIPVQHLHENALYGDMLILGYVLAWGAHALSSNPLDYYDAPIFYPLENMLPGTDGLELPALLLMPVWLLFRNPVLLMNLALFVSHFFALWGAYAATRLVFKLPRTYSVMIAALFAITSDRFWHACGHLNLIWSGILPLVFAGVWVTLENPRVHNAVLLAAAVGLSVYLSVYFFVLSGLTATIAFLCWCISRWKVPTRAAWGFVAVAMVAAALLALPKVLVYKQASAGSSGARNSLAEAAAYSATLKGYLRPTSSPERYTSYWYKIFTVDAGQKQHPEDGQFIGFFVLLLVGAEGVRLAARAVRRQWDGWDRLSFATMGGAGMLVLCSLGPEYTIQSVSPYRVLYYTYLQFSGFYRVPARLAFVVEWLAVVPVAVFLHQAGSALPRLERWLAVPTLLAICWYEHAPMVRPAQFQWERQEIFSVLDEQDPSGDQPYVFVSPDMGLQAALSATDNWRPTVNGWQGSPLGEAFDQRVWSFPDFPTSSSLGWLANNDVVWVLAADPAIQQRAKVDERLSLVDERQGIALYKIEDAAAVASAYRLELEGLKQKLMAGRTDTPDVIGWPGSGIIMPSGGDGFHVDGGKHLYRTGEANFLSTIFDFARAVPPGHYDQIEVEYSVLEGESAHQVKVYWETPEQPFSEKCGMEGVTEEVGNDDGVWRARFIMGDYEWYSDEGLRRLRLDFYNFNGLKPVLLQIKSVKLKRATEMPQIPLM